MTSQAFMRITDSLDAHGSKSRDRRQSHAMYQCPAHEDKNPSLSVDDKGDRVMVYCHSGCHSGDVLASLGLGLRDLFDVDPDHSGGALPVCSYLYEGTTSGPRYIVDRYWPKTFRHRLPGTKPGDTAGIGKVEPILYHAPRVWQVIKAENTVTVWVVDGERDVETAEKHGLVATCPPGFGKTWRANYTTFLNRAAEVVIVADQDPMKVDGTLGKGQEFARQAVLALRAVGCRVRVVAPAVGKDLTDHFDGGYTVEDFVPEPTASIRPRGLNAAELMTKEFEPVCFAVDRILPAGLTIFAGSPKAGKSWMALDLCLSIACGGEVFSAIRTTQGCALYLAREDTYKRLKERIKYIMGGEPPPKFLEVIPQEHDWPGGTEGLAYLSEWAEECGSPRVVVLDTIAKVEPEMGESRAGGAYTGNYSMMGRYKAWADKYNCSVVMVHHDRKQAASSRVNDASEDPFMRISGTRGLTGAADTLWFLETVRGKGEGYLHITGRDVAEQTLDLLKFGPLWKAMNYPE